MIMSIKKGHIDELEYTSLYLKQLKNNNFDPQQWVDSLHPDTFILCYEPSNEFCHRRVLAEYIRQQTGIQIPEWKNPKEQKKQEQEDIMNNLLVF